MKSPHSLLAAIALAVPAFSSAQDTQTLKDTARVASATDKDNLIVFQNAEEFPDAAFDLIAKSKVVWFGEMHGTEEAPALFLGLVRLVRKADKAPVIGLEIPTTDQSAIDEYMQTGDESILRTRTYFKDSSDDGRASEAMAKLLQDLRAEKVAKVICFQAVMVSGDQAMNEKMATILFTAFSQCSDSKLLVLSGNVHSRVTSGTPWNKDLRPAAFELSKIVSPVIAFNMAYEGGTAWNINREGAGAHVLKGRPWNGQANNYISLNPTPVNGHQGVIFTRTVTASPPWVRKTPEPKGK